jgi:DNA-binding GntR family transcriptional regulator
LLELPAARKAAIAATKDTVEIIERLNNQYVSAQEKNDADRALSVNRQFHFTIYRGAKMPILLSMIKNL